MNISYRKNELEEKMLMNLHRKKWTRGLMLSDFETVAKKNAETLKVALKKGQHLVFAFLFGFSYTRSPVGLTTD